ncbi:hypothetical protein WA026_003957 [Henosepilachna vigintioctopunctata]|uniref:LysM domain-containing protein n=1 Tax=Henosepilachna vigintioctopunctata TaxID=420089 RepID=A0AAW1UEN5_9CUCU
MNGSVHFSSLRLFLFKLDYADLMRANKLETRANDFIQVGAIPLSPTFPIVSGPGGHTSLCFRCSRRNKDNSHHLYEMWPKSAGRRNPNLSMQFDGVAGGLSSQLGSVRCRISHSRDVSLRIM